MPAPPLDRAAVCVIAIGGGLGGLARYGLYRVFPVEPDRIPWSTLAINVSGSLCLGMLIVAVTDIWRPHRLIRPLLGTGVLGGFTTFSTFAIEASELSALTASAYVAASVIGGVAAAALGIAAVRKIEPQLHPATTHEQVDPLDPDLP